MKSEQIEILGWEYDPTGWSNTSKFPFWIAYQTADNEDGENEEEFLTDTELADILKHLLLIEDYNNGSVAVKFMEEQLPNGPYEHTQKETIHHCSMEYFLHNCMNNQAFTDIAICLEKQKMLRKETARREKKLGVFETIAKIIYY